MDNMIKIIDEITKESDSKIVSQLIIDTEMDERIENMENEEWKYVVKSMIYATRCFADKGLKTHAHMLSQEHFSQEDIDGNGLIYGIDFVYENPPEILQQITEKTKDKVEKVIKWKPIRKKLR